MNRSPPDQEHRESGSLGKGVDLARDPVKAAPGWSMYREGVARARLKGLCLGDHVEGCGAGLGADSSHYCFPRHLT